MATKSDVKKQLEAILGYKLGDDGMQFIQLMQSVASSTVSDGSTTQKSLLVARPNRCYQTRLLDVSGFWVTGPDGKSVFRLTDFICRTGETLSQPINVVATPLSSTPFFLTVLHSLVNNATDVDIKYQPGMPTGRPHRTFGSIGDVELRLHRSFCEPSEI